MNFNDGDDDQQTAAPITQTQGEVKSLIHSIFGDSDDDDDDNNVGNNNNNNNKQPVSDRGNSDSEDEGDNNNSNNSNNNNSTRKRIAVTSNRNKESSPAPINKYDDILKDSDDEGDGKNNADDGDDSDNSSEGPKRRRLSKGSRKSKQAATTADTTTNTKRKSLTKASDKETKRRNKRTNDHDGKKIKKRNLDDKDNLVNKEKKKEEDDGEASGDEYDSGDEVVVTEDDRNFIAKDDEQKDIVDEYDADEQNFDDERPDSKHSKGKGKRGGDGDNNNNGPKKSDDPISLTMEMLKKPKHVGMSETEKMRVATELMTRMDAACRRDDELFRQGKPAINKLNLLNTVKQIVSMKSLQLVLLDHDLLNVFKDWIDIREANVLPSLPVRTAVYELLLQLPCTVDHLKRAPEGKQPIGSTIVSLRKHPQETVDNKRLLKEIMEKWSRDIFRKSTDPRNIHTRENTELKEVVAMRELKTLQLEREKQEAAARGNAAELNVTLNNSHTATAQELNSRVRTPYSSGFLFTVRPEFKPLVPMIGADNNNGISSSSTGTGLARGSALARNSNDNENENDPRQKLLQSLKEHRKKSGKQNTRAVNVALTGRNKA